MPVMDVTYPEGALSPDQRDELSEGLMAALLRAERAPDTEFFRNVTWIYLHELPEACVRSAGKPVAAPTFKIDVTTPEGALSDRRRAEFAAEAARVVREVTEIPENDGIRIMTLMHEVANLSWGAEGRIVDFQELAEIAKQEREAGEAARAG